MYWVAKKIINEKRRKWDRFLFKIYFILLLFYVEFLLRRSCRYGFFKYRISNYQLNVDNLIIDT